MSDVKFGLKVAAICFFYLASLLAVYVLTTMYKPKNQKPRCPPCKSECKKKPNMQEVIRSNAESLYNKWYKKCNEHSKKAFVNVMSCIRWGKLRKYLKQDYADQVMVVRRMIAHLVLDMVGQELCSNRDKPFVKNELKAQSKNMRENLRRLKKIIQQKPDLKMPIPKECHKKGGKFIWAPP